MTKIPVFFKADGKKVKHFGFSKLYRLNNGHYLNELQPLKDYKDKKELDLATTLFGHTNGENPLKGRVYFSNAKHIENKGEGQTEERILSTPNPSYYPFYLEQKSNENYKTYVNESSSLKGFKRYPVHSTIKAGDLQKDSMSSKFKPLLAGNKFKFKIRYHNLKPAEIGALYSAIVFHNTASCYHTLGGGKPYGFGKISARVTSDETRKAIYLNEFETEMERHFKTSKSSQTSWISSNQVKELIANAKDSTIDSLLVYPQLELKNVAPRDQNEFNNYKKSKSHLKPHSENIVNLTINSIKSEFDKLQAEENKLKIAEAIVLKTQANESLANENYDLALEVYGNAMSIYDDGTFLVYEKEVNSLRNQKAETDAYNLAKTSAKISALEDFIKKYPISIHREEIEITLRSLTAVSGIPSNIIDKDNFKQFANNTDNWVKKLIKENQTILGLGFEKEHVELLVKIGKSELKIANLAKDWHNDKNFKRIMYWYDEDKVTEILKTIHASN